MSHISKVNIIKNLCEQELKKLTPIKASWHMEYKDSSYIHISGLNYKMNEGDIVTVFAQYGEIVDCLLLRDKITGKSKGSAFLSYEDQRSTILAICDRILKVDHVKNFKIPKEYYNMSKLDVVNVNENNKEEFINNNIYKPSGPDGYGWGRFRNSPKS